MKKFKDIFEKWEQENNFNYEKILKDKDDDSEKLQDFCGLKKKTAAKEVSIDLHGLTRYDAIAKLDSLLYKYKNASDTKICIIHGAGIHSKENEPVLKKVVNQYLKNNPLVRYFRPGRSNEGGFGVTIAFLKNQK
jgi:DNA-nicking Smr family endonuclease